MNMPVIMVIVKVHFLSKHFIKDLNMDYQFIKYFENFIKLIYFIK